jgi:hypothetical protein
MDYFKKKTALGRPHKNLNKEDMRLQRFWVTPHVGKSTHRKLLPTYLVFLKNSPA